MLSRQQEQEERRQLAGSTTAATTYRDLSALNAEPGGRFTAVNPPLEAWPKLPSGPWSGADPVGLEPSLGYSVDDQEPTGSYQEIQASINRLARASSTETSSLSADGTVTTGVAPASDRGTAPPSSSEGGGASFTRRRFT
jgi:hypothetical protein